MAPQKHNYFDGYNYCGYKSHYFYWCHIFDFLWKDKGTFRLSYFKNIYLPY